FTHRAIDGMLDLAREHDLKPQDVADIHVELGETALLVLRNHTPKTGLEAKFSMEFAMASALVARQVGLGELTDGFVRRADVVDAMGKVTCSTIPSPAGDPFAPADSVRVRLRSGETLAHAP